MAPTPKVAFNPLPWYFSEAGWNVDGAPTLPEIYAQIRDSGFDAVHAEVPQDMSVAAYRTLLDDVGLAPAPGYFQAPFSDSSATADTAERARRVASGHAELGLTRIFIADQFAAQERIARPAVGSSFDASRFDRLTANLAATAQIMVAEGVTPCLHQHVGTWIETPDETSAVLAAIDPDVLMFGPDTGHLAWAGADPALFIERFLDRVGAVHLKDYRSAVHGEAAAAGSSYLETVGRHLFTEPGRGDVDLAAVLRLLSGFGGWIVVEVDIADQPTPQETARVSADWVRQHVRPDREELSWG